MGYKEERFDIVYYLRKIIGSNDIDTVEELKELLVKYMEYIESVVKHVTYSYDALKYGTEASRENLEVYNGERTSAHNEAIKATLKLQEKSLQKHGIVFCNLCLGKKTIKDFNPGERMDIGAFIFTTISTCSTLTEREKEQIGGDVQDIMKEVSDSKSKLERGYKVEITDDIEDINKSLR